MPTARRARYKCREPGCPELLTTPGRCTARGHASKYDRAIKTRSPWRDYGSDWKRKRKRYLRDHPWCECRADHPRCCGGSAASTEVHHVVPLREIGHHDGPLQALCKACHGAATQRENVERRRPGGG